MFDYNYSLAAELGYERSVRRFKMMNATKATKYCEKRQFEIGHPVTVVSKVRNYTTTTTINTNIIIIIVSNTTTDNINNIIKNPTFYLLKTSGCQFTKF